MSSEYDNRQYRLMANYIDYFDHRKINLRKLIDTLKALLDCLEQPEQEWKKAFVENWATLEEEYAVALFRGQKTLDSESQDLVEASVKTIKELVQTRIQNEGDDEVFYRACNKPIDGYYR